MTDDQDKRAAFEELKDELRGSADAQEFLDLLRLSKRGPTDDSMVDMEARKLAKSTWENTLRAGDDYIPLIQHSDYRVRDTTLKLISCLSMKLSKAAETQRMSHRGFQSLCHIRVRTVQLPPTSL